MAYEMRISDWRSDVCSSDRSQSFMDYLIPSSHEIPDIHIVDRCTPSPLTVVGQKGSGEAGYLGAPAAIVSAVNDALAGLGLDVTEVPINMARLGDRIARAKR